MPKKVATIDKFKTGAHSIQDPRDLPEGAVADAVNVMTDVEGKVRQMGRDISHPLTKLLMILVIILLVMDFLLLNQITE